MSGLSTLLQEIQPFKIGERTFVFKPLGIKHTFKVLAIAKQAAQFGMMDSTMFMKQFNLENLVIKTADGESHTLNTQNLMMILAPLLGIVETETLILDFLEEILQERVRNAEDNGFDDIDVTLSDANVFPAGSEMVLFSELAMHPSIEAFISLFLAAKESKAVQKVSNYLSK